MRIAIGFAALAGTVLSVPASAQTTNCQWIGSIWTCNQVAPLNLPPSVIYAPSVDPAQVGSSIMDSFRQGVEDRQRADHARLEAERLRAETELLRAQAAAMRPPPPAPMVPLPTVSDQPPTWFLSWRQAVATRRGLFPDFDSVVFAPGAILSMEMLILLTSSPLAADISYYLGTHRAEATAISKMPLLDAARAIDRIEQELKATAPTGN